MTCNAVTHPNLCFFLLISTRSRNRVEYARFQTVCFDMHRVQNAGATAVLLLFLLLNCFDIGACLYVSVFGLCYSVSGTQAWISKHTFQTRSTKNHRYNVVRWFLTKFDSLYGYLFGLLTYLAPLFFFFFVTILQFVLPSEKPKNLFLLSAVFLNAFFL